MGGEREPGYEASTYCNLKNRPTPEEERRGGEEEERGRKEEGDPPLRRRVVIVNNKSQTNMHAVIFSNLIGPCYCYSVAEVVLMLESI